MDHRSRVRNQYRVGEILKGSVFGMSIRRYDSDPDPRSGTLE